MTPFLGLGSTDCERLGSGLFAQPVNTVSSFAFLLVGVWIVFRGRSVAGHRVELAIFGLAVASNAAGGLLFHGLQTSSARWVHDLCILSVVLFIVAFDVARFQHRSTSWTAEVYLASLGVLGLVLALLPNVTLGLFAALGIAIGGLELADYRRELPVVRAEGFTARRLARLGVLVALALGTTAFLVGLTGSPLCLPESAFQWHAVWHVLAAVAMGLYAYGAIEPHPADASSPARR